MWAAEGGGPYGAMVKGDYFFTNGV
jgi:hypothetical protein